MRKVAVIGLGRFGMAVARQLAASGVQVIAIDRNGQYVAEIKDDVDIAVKLDSTDKHALVAQDIGTVDVCVVSIGENFEAALLTTAIVKQLGIPEVICRAQTDVHAEIFSRIGADQVIQPERETGTTLARQLANPHLVDFIRLAEGFLLIELVCPREFEGKSLRHVGLRNRFDVNLVVIKRNRPGASPDPASDAASVIVPGPDEVLQPRDILVLVGSDASLSRLPKE